MAAKLVFDGLAQDLLENGLEDDAGHGGRRSTQRADTRMGDAVCAKRKCAKAGNGSRGGFLNPAACLTRADVMPGGLRLRWPCRFRWPGRYDTWEGRTQANGRPFAMQCRSVGRGMKSQATRPRSGTVRLVYEPALGLPLLLWALPGFGAGSGCQRSGWYSKSLLCDHAPVDATDDDVKLPQSVPPTPARLRYGSDGKLPPRPHDLRRLIWLLLGHFMTFVLSRASACQRKTHKGPSRTAVREIRIHTWYNTSGMDDVFYLLCRGLIASILCTPYGTPQPRWLAVGGGKS